MVFTLCVCSCAQIPLFLKGYQYIGLRAHLTLEADHADWDVWIFKSTVTWRLFLCRMAALSWAVQVSTDSAPTWPPENSGSFHIVALPTWRLLPRLNGSWIAGPLAFQLAGRQEQLWKSTSPILRVQTQGGPPHFCSNSIGEDLSYMATLSWKGIWKCLQLSSHELLFIVTLYWNYNFIVIPPPLICKFWNIKKFQKIKSFSEVWHQLIWWQNLTWNDMRNL